MTRSAYRPLAALATTVLVAACAGSSGSPTLGPEATGSPAPSPTTTPSPTASPTIEPSPTDEQPPTDPTPPPGSELLTLAACPVPRPTAPACLDSNTNGLTPGRTTALAVGQSAAFSVTVHNAGPGVSPPITMLLFTFEPPWVLSFLTPTICNGCRIVAGNPGVVALEWTALAPGDHVLSVTLKLSDPTAAGGSRGSDYEWVAALYAESLEAVNPNGPVYTSAAFALATGETTVKP